MHHNLDKFITFYKQDSDKGVDHFMSHLNIEVTLIETKMIDFYLGQMTSPTAIERVTHYLFNGTQIQRNYSTLFLARKNIWKPINVAYQQGLIDYKQAYSR